MTSPRHSYRSVSRFFPAIQAVLDASDKPNVSVIEVNPVSLGLSPATAAARLRDAIQAVRTGVVVVPFDGSRFNSISLEWMVTNNATAVHLIHKTRRAEQVAQQDLSKLMVELKGQVVVERILLFHEAEALASLLSGRILEGEYKVRFPEQFDLDKFKSLYDITIIDNEDGTHTLI